MYGVHTMDGVKNYQDHYCIKGTINKQISIHLFINLFDENSNHDKHEQNNFYSKECFKRDTISQKKWPFSFKIIDLL